MPILDCYLILGGKHQGRRLLRHSCGPSNTVPVL